MTWIRRGLVVLSLFVTLLMAVGAWYYCKGFSSRITRLPNHPARRSLEAAERQRLDERRTSILSFAAAHGYNTQTAFLVDMSLPSGKDRFFVVGLQKDTLLLAGLVAHGCGSHSFSIRPAFSNIDGSSCSSLGKYRIGASYNGRFGRAYKLHGLDSTNNQAYRRNIVLHSFSYVPDAETDPLPICNSRGCPMVSPGFLLRLEPLIDQSSRPILLWIFY